jgi:hypothetical protein
LHDVGPLVDQVAACLDQSRISVKAIIREQENHGFEAALTFDGEGLGGDVALHRGVFVGKERLGIERVRLHLRFIEAALRFEPLEISCHPLLGDEQGACFQIIELRHPWMRDKHLRIFLETRRHDDGRDAIFDCVE